MKALSLSAMLLAITTGQALASSPQQWAEFDKQVVASCTKASQLKEAKAVGRIAQFDDRVGYVAVLLQGRYPQAHMKNQVGRELCLFDKKNKTAFVTEWDSVMPVNRQR
ncbi:hypothetical protein [Pseudomonas akapageensis]|uniref:hypothetical protein n=1 Tax=Pseudomonas akapageensis TaxID=2609961 RepID=UPI0014089B9F|nr:hypothetical protein [Pseudomonas akapageensis]